MTKGRGNHFRGPFCRGGPTAAQRSWEDERPWAMAPTASGAGMDWMPARPAHLRDKGLTPLMNPFFGGCAPLPPAAGLGGAPVLGDGANGLGCGMDGMPARPARLRDKGLTPRMNPICGGCAPLPPAAGLGGAPVLGDGASGSWRKRPRRSSTEDDVTSAPTRVRPSARADVGEARRPRYEAGRAAGFGRWRQRLWAQRAEAVEHGGRRYLRADTSPAVGPSRHMTKMSRKKSWSCHLRGVYWRQNQRNPDTWEEGDGYGYSEN